MSENTKGEWITVRPSDTRIVNGCRVRLGGVEGVARRGGSVIVADDGDYAAVWCSRYDGGPDVELWEPEEETLPLPTGPGVFWGRVERDGDTYTGWVWRSLVGLYATPRDVSCFRVHRAGHVTRLPLPDSEREALR